MKDITTKTIAIFLCLIMLFTHIPIEYAFAVDENAKLSSVSLDDITIDEFNPIVFNYNIDVEWTDTSVTISANTEDVLAQISGDTGTQNLSIGLNTFTITCTAQDDATTQNYVINITREEPSMDATLSDISIDNSNIEGYVRDTYSYNIIADYITSSIDIGAVANDSNTQITGDIGTQDLSVGLNIFTITCTAQDGTTTQDYVLNITREEPSMDAMLSDISIDNSTLEGFVSDAYSYNIIANYITSSVDIGAVANDNNATITGDIGIHDLAIGLNTFTIICTSQDDTATQNYVINITREEPSVDATLSDINIDNSTLEDFLRDTYSYNIIANYITSSVDIGVVANDNNAQITGDIGTQNLSVGLNTFTITCTAQDDVTTQEYVLNITREESSADATLSDISIDNSTLEGFLRDTYSYNIVADYDTLSIDIKAVANDNSAIIIGDIGIQDLVIGLNTFTIICTSQDDTTQDYVLNITREEPSEDAMLSDITIDGSTIDGFDSLVYSYDINIIYTSDTVVVGATANDIHAKITGDIETQSVIIGTNVLTLTCSAQDGITSQDYVLNITYEEDILEPIISTNQIEYVNGKPCFKGEVLIKFNGSGADALINSISSLNATNYKAVVSSSLVKATIPEGTSVEEYIQLKSHLSDIEYIQPNYVYQLSATVNDPYAFPGATINDQWHHDKIDSFEAWDVTMGEPDVLVAVLDTGIDLDHPDLDGQIYLQTDVVDNDGSAEDDVGHGTHVAGIIAAEANNNFGGAGIAPDSKLIIVDVFTKYYQDDEWRWGASSEDVIEGINYAVTNGADVINMSIGSYSYDAAKEAAINSAVANGVVVVCSAGNDNITTDHYPSDFDACISVISTDINDNKASSSNYGSQKDISAPGDWILSTYPVSAEVTSGYVYMSGTSMASPVIAGVCALILSANPDLTVDQVKSVLYSTADDLGTAGKDNYYGWGRVNANAAVIAAEPTLSADVALSNLLVDSVTIVGFNQGTNTYHISCDSSKSTVILSAVSNNSNAQITGDTGTQNLSDGLNTFTITCTAQDTTTTQEYTINISKVTSSTANGLEDLGFIPLDIVIDPDRTVAYMTEVDGYKLYHIDLNTGDTTYLVFEYKVENIAINNSKLFLSLAIDSTNGSVIVMDTETFNIINSFNISQTANYIVADEQGILYITQNYSLTALSYNSYTGEMLSAMQQPRSINLWEYNDLYNKIYVVSTNGTPDDMGAYEIIEGKFVDGYDSPYHGDYSLNEYFKLSPDGQYIYNGLGNIFTCTSTEEDDMIYDGNIDEFTSISFNLNNNEFYTVIDSILLTYNYTTRTIKEVFVAEDSYVGIFFSNDQLISLLKNTDDEYYFSFDPQISDYLFPLKGTNTSEADGLTDLEFIPLDTVIDPNREVAYMTEEDGYKLYRVDLTTGEIKYIEFKYKVVCLTVKNGKVYVALSHLPHSYSSGSISIIDTNTFTLINTFYSVINPYDIEVDDQGIVYIAHGYGQHMTSYDSIIGECLSTSGSVYYNSQIEYNTIYNKLYSVDQGLSPGDIYGYNIEDGKILTRYDSPYHGDYTMNPYILISPDGQYIFNGSGNIFTCAPTQVGDMIYDGNIEEFSSVCFNLDNNNFYISSNSILSIYNYDTREKQNFFVSDDSFIDIFYDHDKLIMLQKNSSDEYYFNLDSIVWTIPDEIVSSVYTIDRDNLYISDVPDETTIADFKTNIDNLASQIKIFSTEGTEVTTGLVGTKMVVKLIVDSEIHDELVVCILGDISGDGIIDIIDYSYVKLHIFSVMTLADVQFASADIDGNNAVDIIDYSYVKLDIFDVASIN